MQPIDFLRHVWPDRGLYCLATPAKNGTGYIHNTFATLKEAVMYVGNAAALGKDVYFATHTLLHPDMKRPNGKIGIRIRENMKAARVFFFDIDIDPSKDDDRHYPDVFTAEAALKNFVTDTGLPEPTVINSGGGRHVYWPLEEPIPSEEWRGHAARLKALAQKLKLRVDPSRTVDTTSVLRVAGTANHKKATPRPVELVSEGKPTPNDAFLALLDAACKKAQVEEAAPRPTTPSAPATVNVAGMTVASNMGGGYDGYVPAPNELARKCAQFAKTLAEVKVLDNTRWYAIQLPMLLFSKGGREAAHRVSSQYPGYSAAETDAKLDQIESNQTGMTTCQKIHEVGYPGLCEACPVFNLKKSPITACTYKVNEEPPPIVAKVDDDFEVTITPPPMPAGFIRAKNANGHHHILRERKVKSKTDENKLVDVQKVILHADLYPIRFLGTNNFHGESAKHEWMMQIPNNPPQRFVMENTEMHDRRECIRVLSSQGMSIQHTDFNDVVDYMGAYILQLQKLAAAERQYGHLGWTDNTHDAFVLPKRVIKHDGTSEACSNSVDAQAVIAKLHIGETAGTLEGQIKQLEFFNHDCYLPHQFLILAQLAAPFMYATGKNGLIVHATGETSASKSTALFTGAGFWGHPKSFCVNATDRGSTERFKDRALDVLSALPACYDELELTDPLAAKQLALHISQGATRATLDRNQRMRTTSVEERALLMCSTSNKSFHAVIAAAPGGEGFAGSMRIIEINIPRMNFHTPNQADNHSRSLTKNYGHIGPAFMQMVMPIREQIEHLIEKECDAMYARAGLIGGERYWGHGGGLIFVIGRIAQRAGLVPFDVDKVMRWYIEKQIPAMRASVNEEYVQQDPVQLLTNFIAENSGQTLITITLANGEEHPQLAIHGALTAHYLIDKHVLYLLKSKFKDYCIRRGANFRQVIKALLDQGIIIKEDRRVLGAKTVHAISQSYVYIIDMNHAALSATHKHLSAVPKSVPANTNTATQTAGTP